jgi:hypothetical protein
VDAFVRRSIRDHQVPFDHNHLTGHFIGELHARKSFSATNRFPSCFSSATNIFNFSSFSSWAVVYVIAEEDKLDKLSHHVVRRSRMRISCSSIQASMRPRVGNVISISSTAIKGTANTKDRPSRR